MQQHYAVEVMRSGAAKGRRRKAKVAKQTCFVFRTWGGLRRGAGRRRGADGAPGHSARPKHSRHHPLHVTLRVVAGVPSLRSKQAFRVVKKALELANREG